MCIFGILLQICFRTLSKIHFLIYFGQEVPRHKEFQQSEGATEPERHSSGRSLSRPVGQLSSQGRATAVSMCAVQKRNISEGMSLWLLWRQYAD